MQLTPARRGPSLRQQIGAAASLLLASVLPGAAVAAEPATPQPQPGDAAGRIPAEPRWQFEASTLFYKEKDLATILEPIARFTRLFHDGQTFSAQLGLDLMTGASPSGALTSSQTQTTTSPSGTVTTTPAGTRPTHPFEDTRGSLDLEWVRPMGTLFTTTLGGHFSRETDYQSLGGTATFALEVDRRLMTLTLGGGYNDDSVFPAGGAPVGMAPVGAAPPGPALAPSDEGGGEGDEGEEDFPAESKNVTSVLAGLTRVLTRRWLVGASWARTLEDGYLTEPYKVVSLVDPGTGEPLSQVHENRPSTRERTSLTASSVYHLTRDVFYVTYRAYEDDWGIRSDTWDLRLRHEIGTSSFLQPHLRAYRQTKADFHRLGLDQTAPLPAYASSDSRLGDLNTATYGLTYGFAPASYPGEFTIRVEYIHQWGDNAESQAPGVTNSYDPDPPLDIATVHLGYTRRY